MLCISYISINLENTSEAGGWLVMICHCVLSLTLFYLGFFFPKKYLDETTDGSYST